jgi:putative tryptophan/tyrosine transport system ATP-binding protein
MLTLTDIRKTFHAGTPNEVRALQGVNLKIEQGSFVVVIGTNGSGKSTLLNAVAGAFFVDEGRIELAGHDVTRWPEHRRAVHIGRVFQDLKLVTALFVLGALVLPDVLANLKSRKLNSRNAASR